MDISTLTNSDFDVLLKDLIASRSYKKDVDTYFIVDYNHTIKDVVNSPLFDSVFVSCSAFNSINNIYYDKHRFLPIIVKGVINFVHNPKNLLADLAEVKKTITDATSTKDKDIELKETIEDFIEYVDTEMKVRKIMEKHRKDGMSYIGRIWDKIMGYVYEDGEDITPLKHAVIITNADYINTNTKKQLANILSEIPDTFFTFVVADGFYDNEHLFFKRLSKLSNVSVVPSKQNASSLLPVMDSLFFINNPKFVEFSGARGMTWQV